MTQESESLEAASPVFDSWAARVEEGQAESFEELLEAHPELAQDLQKLRVLHRAMDQALGETAPFSKPTGGRHLMDGKRLGDFRIEREIGRGGMGIVFEAEQISLHRKVALKILPAQLTLNERALTRFRHEAEITGRLHHRGIVEIHQVGEEEGIHFIAMELVEGSSLDRVIDRMRGESFGRVRKRKIADVVSVHGLTDVPDSASDSKPAAETKSKTKKRSSSASNKNYIESSIKLVCQVADALEHAHEAGVIHRDIKPSNILVRGDGSVVLTDFGLAREQGLPTVSATGDFAGTPNYVSPEQAMSGRIPVDHRSDVFSLGATLYELITLELAFPGENSHDVLSRIISKPPDNPQKHNPALAPDLVTILYKALEKDPDRRYASAREFAEDLRAFIEYRPIKAKRTATIVRAWRWVQREPLKAAMGVTVAAALFVSGGLIWRLRSVSQEAAAKDLEVAALGVEKRIALLPEQVDEAFLRLGLGQLDAADSHFREILALKADSLEASVGLVISLLGRERAPEALEEIERLEAEGAFPLRLKVEALRSAKRFVEAQELEPSIGLPQTPVEEYLEALFLIHDRPFVVGVPTRGYFTTQVGRDPAAAPWESGEQGDSILRYRGRAERAIELLKDAVTGSPRAPYRFALCWAAWVARDEETARRYSKDLVERKPDSAIAWCYVGFAREVFDTEGAIEAFERARTLDPELLTAPIRLSVILRKQGEAERAVELLREAGSGRVQTPAFLVNLAESLFLAGRHAEALEYANLALEQDEGLVMGYDARGATLLQLATVEPDPVRKKRHLEDARADFERALELEPEAARLYNDLGWTAYQLGELEEAEEHLLEARRLDPNHPLVVYNLGVVRKKSAVILPPGARRVELLEEAIDLHLAALELAETGDYPLLRLHTIYGSLGNCYHHLKDLDASIEAYEIACDRAPDTFGHHVNLAYAYADAGRNEECRAELETVRELAPEYEDGHRRIVRLYRGLGRFEEELEAAKLWTEALPASRDAWNTRAWLQVDEDGPEGLGDPEDALRAAERALELGSEEDLAVLDTYARALHMNGRDEEALEILGGALDAAQNAGSPALRRNLEASMALIEAGR